MLELKKISKKYSIPGKNDIIALDNITMSFKYNKFYGITGHSGSGKGRNGTARQRKRHNGDLSETN